MLLGQRCTCWARWKAESQATSHQGHTDPFPPEEPPSHGPSLATAAPHPSREKGEAHWGKSSGSPEPAKHPKYQVQPCL